ncbi:MAG TPA: efflux RND transporter periplasmic adaptor subunit, partial [Rhizomicrobium sp.]|nr:efflux RND transporter periplasmic adaptor subunit [Rhizomicrobium sp.]
MSVSEFLPSASRAVKAGAARSSRARWLLWGVGVLLLLGLAWFGYRIFAPSKPHAPPPAPVRTAQAVKEDVTMVQNTIATVVSPATVQVTAQVQGKLLTAYFKEGDLVKRGDPLFLIDPAPFQNALAQAKAQLAKDSATLQSAQNDEKRYTALYSQNAISQQVRDQAVATAGADAATVESDKAAVNIAAENLGYTRITSPIDGKTGPIMIQPGNVIMVAGASNTASPLVTITQIQPIKLSIFLPQTQLPQIQAQMTAGKLEAVVPMPGAQGGKEQAPVDFVSNMVGANNGTIEVRATFPNTDQRLVPGQNVNVGITIGQIAGATVVPRDAVNVGPDNSYVYVVDKNDMVASKTVKVLNDDGAMDAIQGDVKPGDQVVVEGQLRIVPGAKVAIRNNGRQRAS